jgi:hypothetical protein
MRTIQIRRGREFKTNICDIYDENEFFYPEYCQMAENIEQIVFRSDQYYFEHSEFGAAPDIEPFSEKQCALRGYSNNIVAFCANRGHGKSSTMLSMAKALYEMGRQRQSQNRYDQSGNAAQNSRQNVTYAFWKNAHDRALFDVNEAQTNGAYRTVADHTFFVLSPIDPTTLEEHGTILMHILSSLFQYYEKEEEYRLRNGMRYENSDGLLEAFQKAFSSIRELKLPIEKGEDDLAWLAEYGDSRRVHKSFIEVVEQFLEYVEKDMLVIQVDDADLNIRRAFEIVEEIRKYCWLSVITIYKIGFANIF